jgi:hypothetical protein
MGDLRFVGKIPDEKYMKINILFGLICKKVEFRSEIFIVFSLFFYFGEKNELFMRQAA